MKRNICIIGAGGLAREVRWLLQTTYPNRYKFSCFIVSDRDLADAVYTKNSDVKDLPWLIKNKNKVDAIAIAIGNIEGKFKILNELQPYFDESYFPLIIHSSAQMNFISCNIGHGVIICPNVVGTVNLEIEPYSFINLSCTIGHEAKLGMGCNINPGVNISGGCKIGIGAFIGTGAQILQYKTVGDYAVVGAGAVVTKDVPANQTVVGVPAKPIQ